MQVFVVWFLIKTHAENFQGKFLKALRFSVANFINFLLALYASNEFKGLNTAHLCVLVQAKERSLLNHENQDVAKGDEIISPTSGVELHGVGAREHQVALKPFQLLPLDMAITRV